MNNVFKPPFYLRSAAAQTLLAGSRIRTRGRNPMLESAREIILTTSEGVRLQGFYSEQKDRQAKGLVLLLHGWEGSASSGYILSTGKFLYSNGFSVFRLNYRDHGNTHHLNPGLFYAVLLDEVFDAVRQVAEYENGLPFYLAGFSMGGNFALRIARKCAHSPITNLLHVVSVSPVLDPEKSTNAIDEVYPIRRYFLQKWLRSLKKKQECFPDRYDFREGLTLKSVSALTDWMIARYSDYQTASDYFRGYALLGDALSGIPVPTMIIAALDDPIIPIADFYDLKLNPKTELIVHRYGGHNGFLETLSGRAWYEQKMLQVFSATLGNALE